MFGYHGRLLRIDLGTGTSDVDAIPEAVPRAVLGGIGLASLLLYRYCPAGVEPLAAENPLVFATSPFVGTGITTAAKVAVATKSPQAGLIGDSLSSSYLAINLKRTGFDALVVTGRAAGPTLLVVDGARVRFEDATDLRGLDPEATSRAVWSRLGGGFRVAAIGPAGENGVRYASISNDGRLAGRTGAGAVMGAKNLKAIAVRGDRVPPVADPAGLAATARALAARSLGAETAKYREVGTAANVTFFDRLGVLPTRNFQSGHFEGAEAIGGETLLLSHGVDRQACAACTVGCEHRYRTNDGGAPVETRLEYETLFALGALCGVADPNAVLRAARRCDELGIDAISAGATIAWAMECRQTGVCLPQADEVPAFGDAEGVMRTIEAIGHRRGVGDLLAEGSRRAAAAVGQGSDNWAMQVKGLEMPGYDPRKLPTLALGLAVSTRGACHNRSSAYEVDLSDQPVPSGPGSDPAAKALARARAAAATEDQAAILDSLTLCKFLRHCFTDLPAEAAALYTMVTGSPMDGEGLRRAGERINNLKKLFNIREGWTRADDTLPPRIREAVPDLDNLIGAYYRVRGWDERGLIPREHLEQIGLGDVLTAFLGANGLTFSTPSLARL